MHCAQEGSTRGHGSDQRTEPASGRQQTGSICAFGHKRLIDVNVAGRPPRVRGTRQRRFHGEGLRGTTPAHAGSTAAACTPTGPERDHPRVCGEHALRTARSSAASRDFTHFFRFRQIGHRLVSHRQTLTAQGDPARGCLRQTGRTDRFVRPRSASSWPALVHCTQEEIDERSRLGSADRPCFGASSLRHSYRYDLVHARALPPEASTALIQQAMEDFGRCAA